MARFDLTDFEWSVIQPLLATGWGPPPDRHRREAGRSAFAEPMCKAGRHLTITRVCVTVAFLIGDIKAPSGLVDQLGQSTPLGKRLGRRTTTLAALATRSSGSASRNGAAPGWSSATPTRVASRQAGRVVAQAPLSRRIAGNKGLPSPAGRA